SAARESAQETAKNVEEEAQPSLPEADPANTPTAAAAAAGSQATASAVEQVEIFPEIDDNVSRFLSEKFITAGRRAQETKNYIEAERMFLAAIQKLERFGKGNRLMWDAMSELAGVY